MPCPRLTTSTQGLGNCSVDDKTMAEILQSTNERCQDASLYFPPSAFSSLSDLSARYCPRHRCINKTSIQTPEMRFQRARPVSTKTCAPSSEQVVTAIAARSALSTDVSPEPLSPTVRVDDGSTTLVRLNQWPGVGLHRLAAPDQRTLGGDDASRPAHLAICTRNPSERHGPSRGSERASVPGIVWSRLMLR